MHQQLDIQHITLSRHIADFLAPASPATLGNADVLATLLPRFIDACIKTTKPEKRLARVDGYMLEEINQMGTVLKNYATELEISEIDGIQVRRSVGGLSAFADQQTHPELSTLLSTDRWLIGAFAWIEPNLIALANSVELLEYSEGYQRGQHNLSAQYSHLESSNNAMQFCMQLHAGNARARIESPANVFVV